MDAVGKGGYVRFIGTGAGDFYEEHQRDCTHEPCVRARALGGANIRRASAMFISPDILIDFYDVSVLRRQCTNVTDVRHLLITHGHFDHFQPPRIVDAVTEMAEPFTLYGSSAVVEALHFAAAYRWAPEDGAFRRRETRAVIPTVALGVGDTVTVGSARVTAVLAHHMIDKPRTLLQQPALNFVVERGGKTLFYGLDTSEVLPDTFDALKRFRFDAVVLDATYGWGPVSAELSGHMNFAMVQQTAQWFRDAGMLADDAQIIASHISCHHVPPHDDIVDEVAELGIVLAHDGMEIEL